MTAKLTNLQHNSHHTTEKKPQPPPTFVIPRTCFAIDDLVVRFFFSLCLQWLNTDLSLYCWPIKRRDFFASPSASTSLIARYFMCYGGIYLLLLRFVSQKKPTVIHLKMVRLSSDSIVLVVVFAITQFASQQRQLITISIRYHLIVDQNSIQWNDKKKHSELQNGVC